jgi:hypothetical protein
MLCAKCKKKIKKGYWGRDRFNQESIVCQRCMEINVTKNLNNGES